jgi:exodeoxyribonuclease X
MTLRVIDIETTGTDPETDKIIEIASIDLLKGGTCENTQSCLVNPGRKIPPEASAVHHLIDEDVQHARLFDDAIKDFKGADCYIAHNADFEKAFLDQALGTPTWICTMKCALRVWSEAPGHSNQVLRYWLGEVEPLGSKRENLVAHRAVSDVLVTGAIFFHLSKATTYAQMVQWSSEPPLYTYFSFGKYKGQKIADIAIKDESYLTWIIEKSELDEGAKFSARYWLEKKREAA